MQENKVIDIVKGAILLEHKGKALYESVIHTTRIDGVKELFNMLIKEEEKHISILNKQNKRLMKDSSLNTSDLERTSSSVVDEVISDEIKNNVIKAGNESAVISAALEFEKNAAKYYSESALGAESDEEKELFQWLTRWKKGHMHMLAKLDEEIKEKIWFDNRFWPLD